MEGTETRSHSHEDPASWLSFGRWLRHEGVRRVVAGWPRILSCLMGGAFLAVAIPLPLSEVSVRFALALVTISAVVSFGSSIVMMLLLQLPQAQKIGECYGGMNFHNHVMRRLLAIAAAFSVAVLWALIGVHAFDPFIPMAGTTGCKAARCVVFAVTCFAFSETWNSITYIHLMTLSVEWVRRLYPDLSKAKGGE